MNWRALAGGRDARKRYGLARYGVGCRGLHIQEHVITSDHSNIAIHVCGAQVSQLDVIAYLLAAAHGPRARYRCIGDWCTRLRLHNSKIALCGSVRQIILCRFIGAVHKIFPSKNLMLLEFAMCLQHYFQLFVAMAALRGQIVNKLGPDAALPESALLVPFKFSGMPSPLGSARQIVVNDVPFGADVMRAPRLT